MTEKRVTSGRVGRPRANPRPISRPPEEEILLVAGRLFAAKGFAATSTREIAEAAGLRQPSLFHYYPKKERILATLIERIGKWTLDYADQLDRLEAPASVKLYKMVFFDVHAICTAPYSVAAILFLPEVRPPNYPRFQRDLERLTDIMHSLIVRGVLEGDFETDDALLSADALRGMSDSTLLWHFENRNRDPEELAHHVATLELRSLLKDPRRVHAIRQASKELKL